jgi:hypothetical protein
MAAAAAAGLAVMVVLYTVPSRSVEAHARMELGRAVSLQHDAAALFPESRA